MAGRIPEKFIDELLVRTDIVDVIDSRVPLKKAGKDYKACCPFHEEKTASFTVSADKQFYHCFGCGAHGTAIGFLMEYERMSFPEAIEDLAATAGLTVPRAGGDDYVAVSAERREADTLLEMLGQADAYFRRQLREHPKARLAIDYLKDRGLTGEIAATFGMGYAPDGWDNLLKALGTDEDRRKMLKMAGLIAERDKGGYYDRFRDRVMFPIHDYRGRVVGFGGRVLGQGEPKYLNSPETPLFHKGREMYGLYRARDAIRREQRVLVVEGYMDVVALAQFGIDYVVATLGTATTKDHLERVFRFAPEVVFCFDGDRAGREAAWRALEQALVAMHSGRQASFLFLPEGDDPDSLVRREGRQGLEARLRAAIPLPEHLLEYLSQQVDLNRLDGRARLVELARPLLNKVTQGPFRDLLIQAFAKRSGMSLEKFSKSLNSEEKPLSSGMTTGPGRPGRSPKAMRSVGIKAPPSLVRSAVTLLLQRPELAREVEDYTVLTILELPGMGLLIQILDLLNREPSLQNGAQVLERFRDTEHEAPLQKLMAQQSVLEDDETDAQRFADALAKFRRDAAKQRIEQITASGSVTGLSEADKAELAQNQKILTQAQKT
ncbi:MAG: DNA primase [Gammaproteobacteria bacterium]|nr:MAG: DNA primase [Gammaproteobacteria bacterium]